MARHRARAVWSLEHARALESVKKGVGPDVRTFEARAEAPEQVAWLIGRHDADEMARRARDPQQSPEGG